MARLRPLSEHQNVRFGEKSYDVRKWSVRTRVDEEEVGTVHDVLLDENARTRYLDVELSGGRHVLIPSGDAQVDPTAEVVHVPGLDRQGLSSLPAYDHRPETITPEYTRSLTTAYDTAYSDEHYYERPDYTARWSRGTSTTTEGGERSGTLARLDQLEDVDIASGEHDPRGWDVVGADGERVGRVEHVIGDTGAMKARYLTVELDDAVAADRHHVLLPVGHVDLDTGRNRVVSRALDRERASALPRFEGGGIDREYEAEVTRHYGEAYRGERLYEHPRYRSDVLDTEEARVERAEEELAVGTRERESGEVDVKKRVETEHVREPVNVHREEVDVERRPAAAAGRETEIGEEEVRIPVHEEEVVAEKRPRVKEEVVVRKRDVEETEVVEEDVRKERVDVERTDGEPRR